MTRPARLLYVADFYITFCAGRQIILCGGSQIIVYITPVSNSMFLHGFNSKVYNATPTELVITSPSC